MSTASVSCVELASGPSGRGSRAPLRASLEADLSKPYCRRKSPCGYERPRKSAESLLLALIARRAARVRARSSKCSSDPATEIAAAAWPALFRTGTATDAILGHVSSIDSAYPRARTAASSSMSRAVDVIVRGARRM